MVPCRVKEEARKADKQLTLVPIIFLFLRSWSMIRFCIYLVSSAQQSQSLLDAQEILIYLQVSVLYFCLCVDMSRRSISLQAGFIKSAAGRAFLRPREDMRRIGERFAGGVALISVRPPPADLWPTCVAYLIREIWYLVYVKRERQEWPRDHNVPAFFSRLPYALCRFFVKVSCFAFAVISIRFSSNFLSQSRSLFPK